jgi:DNA-binding response OmpR family regulator
MNGPLSDRAPGRRMLVVDDEAVITSAMFCYFTHHGFEVHCAAECEEALALLSYHEYDIIVADMRLTGTESEEGLEVIRQARERSSDVCIVLLTAYGAPGLDEKAARAGANALLQKPQALAELAKTVRALLGVNE